MKLYEPATAITDLILGVFSLVLAWKLWRRAAAQASRRYWAGALGASGIAALLGAFFHGAGPQVSRATLEVTWKAVTMSVGVVSFCLVSAAAIASLVAPLWRRLLRIAAAIQLIVYAAWMARHDDFIYVIAGYGTAMIIVAFLQLRDLRAAPSRARLILAGIGVSVGGAIVQASGVALHRHFNHNDLYHVIQLVATYLLYRGGLLLGDQGEPQRRAD